VHNQIRKLSDKWKESMKKIISLLMILAVITAGVPMTFAAEDQRVDPVVQGGVQKDNKKVKISELISREGVIFLSAVALGFLAMASSGNGGSTTPSHH
jgi:hypothetical protein